MNKNQLKLVENDHKFCYWWWYKNKNISINCKGFILYKIIIIILYQPTHFLEEIRALNYNLKKKIIKRKKHCCENLLIFF